MKSLILIALAMVVGIPSFILGGMYQQDVSARSYQVAYATLQKYSKGYQEQPVEPMTTQDALFYLRVARASHQFFVDYPERTNTQTGTPADNARWVEHYDGIIALLKTNLIEPLIPMAWELTSKYAGSKVGKGWK